MVRAFVTDAGIKAFDPFISYITTPVFRSMTHMPVVLANDPGMAGVEDCGLSDPALIGVKITTASIIAMSNRVILVSNFIKRN